MIVERGMNVCAAYTRILQCCNVTAPFLVGGRVLRPACLSICLSVFPSALSQRPQCLNSPIAQAAAPWDRQTDGSRYSKMPSRAGWLGSRVVSVLDSGAEGPGFKSQSRRCRVTVLGKLFTPIVPLFTKQQNWYQPS